MNKGYCLYYHEKPIRIVSILDEHEWQLAKKMPGVYLVESTGIESIREVMDNIVIDSVKEVWLGCNNIDECCSDFKSVLQFVMAGGGLVKNEKNEFLFIFRKGKWDLPKGKLDDFESIEECAVREVVEETGLKNVALQGHLCDTHHIYLEKGNFILKESVWFNMDADSGQKLQPQTEEGIHEIIWLAPSKWDKVLENTYPSVKDVLEESGLLSAIKPPSPTSVS